MGNLEDLIEKNPIPTGRPFAYLIIIVLVAAVVWSVFTELEEVSSAEATVVPRE